MRAISIFTFVLFSVCVQAQTFWTAMNGPFGGQVTDHVVHSSGAIVVSTQSNGLWRSTDTGATWTKMTTGTDVFFNDLDMDASGNIYAPTSTKIYKSTDGGANWVNLNSTGLTTSTNRIKVANATTIYVAASNNLIFKSTNSGVSFAQSSSDISVFINEFTSSPANASVVFAATSGHGVKYSTDGGFVFNTGTGSIIGTDYVYSVIVNSTGTAFAMSGTGIHKSTDNGATWTSITGTIADGSFYGRLAFDGSQNVYVANSNSLKIYTGNTTGSTWNAGVNFPAHITLSSFSIQSATNWLLTSSSNGVFRTTDSGANWTGINETFKSLSTSRVFVTAQGRIFITYSNGTGYYQSIDNGATWSFVSASPANRSIIGFLKLSDNSVIAYGNSGVIRSTGTIGNTWVSQNTSNFLPQVISYDGASLYSYNGNNILKSTDQGVTWASTAITGMTGSIVKLQMDATNIYARTTASNLYSIPIAGSAATLINTAQDFSVYNSGVNSTIYTLSNSTTLQISTNGGVSWPTVKNINVSYSANKLWAFRNNVLLSASTSTANVNISYDAGSTWVAYPLADATARAIDIILDGTEKAVVATTNSTAFKSINTVIPPLAPVGLTIAAANTVSSGVTLIWADNSDNETGFPVEVSEGNNTSWVVNQTSLQDINVQNKSWTTVGGLNPNTTYYFRVAATNAGGQSAYSNEVSITTAPTICASAIPNNRSWTATATADAGSTASGPGPFTNATIQILKVGANNYQAALYTLGVAPIGSFPARPVNTNLSVANFSENCGKTVLVPFNYDLPNGEGTWNGTNTVTLKWQSMPDYNFFQGTTTFVLNGSDPIPTTPAFNAYIYSSTETLINWSQVQFETQYKIYRATVSGGPFTLVQTKNYGDTYYIDKNLTPGINYYYKVSAVNSTGESPLSAEQAVNLSTSTLFRPIESDISLNFENQQGVSWGDLDGDGDEDIASPSFTNSLGASVPPVFYENTGSNTFARRDLSVLTDENTGVSRGIAIFDFNNDSKLDLYITRSGVGLNDLLLVNNGSWNFTKTVLTETAGPSGIGFRGLGVLDYDKDGFADVYVGNDNGGASPSTLNNWWLKNNGSLLTKTTGGIETTEFNNSRSTSSADYDNDGDQDIFTLNWASSGAEANHLYRNNGNGTFTKVTGLVFDSDLFAAARTISWGDIDNDGDLDLYVGSQSAVDRLYQNNGDGTFTYLSGSVVSEAATATFGSSFGDIDNDGDLDLIAINSAANSIFINNGSGTFTKSAIPELLIHPAIFEIGGAFADFDNDGFLDFYPAKGQTNAVNLPNLLYKNTNTASASKHWLEVKLVGTVSNKAAIGARVKAITTSPARTQIREVTALTGYGSQNSLIQHFGLGTATTVSTLEVRWPNGKIQTFTNITANQKITITEDATGPTFSGYLPANAATNVSSSTKLEFTLNEASVPVNGKKIKVFLSTDLVNPVHQIDATAGTKTSETYSFTLPAKLVQGSQYQVTIDDGAFTDAFSNNSLAVSTGWSFTIGNGPSISSKVPVHATTNINTTTKIDITFTGTTTGVAGKKIKVYKQSDTTTPVFQLDAANGFPTANTLSFTLPGKLELSTNYSVTVDAGAFLDNLQNESVAIAQGSWTFQTTAGPGVTLFSPLNNAIDVVNDASIELTFGTNITAVAGKKIKVMNASTQLLNADVSTNGTITGNKYSIPAPGAKWPYSTKLDVIVDAGAFIDAAQNDFAGINSGLWSFTIIEQPDATPPTITPPSVTTLAKGFATGNLTMTVTDNKAVNTVVVSIRKISGSAYSDITATAGGTPNTYTMPLTEGTHFDETGTEFYITATDAAGNATRSPAGTATQKIYLTYTENQSKIPADRLGFGGLAANWKIFSIPFELGTNNSVTSIFNELEGKDSKKDFRLITYGTPTAWSEYPGGFSSIHRGQGYFINIKNPVDIAIGNNLPAPSNSRSNLFTLNLAAGWNMIGNPYLTQISWANVATLNGLTGQAADLKKYTGSGYSTQTQTLAPFEGAFVFAQTAIANVAIPFLGQTVAGGRKGFADLGSDINQNEWALKLNLTQGQFIYDLGSVGMTPEANLSLDDYDDITPPRFFDYLELNFSHPEHFAKRFTRDVVPTQSNYTWDFTVDSNLDGQAELTWDNGPLQGGSKEIFLLDISRQKLINMKDVGIYSFNPKESVNFRIYFGENLKIAPDKVHLGKAYPNPTSGNTTMAFSLPESGGIDQSVTLDIVDAMGKELGTVSQGIFNPGYHEVSWNARELNIGFYTYRLTVRSKQGRTILVNKLIIK